MDQLIRPYLGHSIGLWWRFLAVVYSCGYVRLLPPSLIEASFKTFLPGTKRPLGYVHAAILGGGMVSLHVAARRADWHFQTEQSEHASAQVRIVS